MLPCANGSVKFLKAVFMWGVFSAPGPCSLSDSEDFHTKGEKYSCFLAAPETRTSSIHGDCWPVQQ